MEALNRLDPKVVLLVGCRIVKPRDPARDRCPVLNYHAGINPQYRGMNGGYWALASGDAGNFGTTVHLVDAGVDTGGILYQARGKPAPDDNIMTYAHRLAALSRDMCVRAVGDALDGRLTVIRERRAVAAMVPPDDLAISGDGFTRGVW